MSTSCSTIQVPDTVWYGSLGVTGAVGFHTLTAGEQRLSFKDWIAKWDNLSDPEGPMICTHTASFAKLKSAFEKLCNSTTGTCQFMTPDQQTQLNNFTNEVKKLNGRD